MAQGDLPSNGADVQASDVGFLAKIRERVSNKLLPVFLAVPIVTMTPGCDKDDSDDLTLVDDDGLTSTGSSSGVDTMGGTDSGSESDSGLGQSGTTTGMDSMEESGGEEMGESGDSEGESSGGEVLDTPRFLDLGADTITNTETSGQVVTYAQNKIEFHVENAASYEIGYTEVETGDSSYHLIHSDNISKDGNVSVDWDAPGDHGLDMSLEIKIFALPEDNVEDLKATTSIKLNYDWNGQWVIGD